MRSLYFSNYAAVLAWFATQLNRRRGGFQPYGGRPPRAPWVDGAPATDAPGPEDLSLSTYDAPGGASEAN